MHLEIYFFRYSNLFENRFSKYTLKVLEISLVFVMISTFSFLIVLINLDNFQVLFSQIGKEFIIRIYLLKDKIFYFVDSLSFSWSLFL
jgi:hypothetical protein